MKLAKRKRVQYFHPDSSQIEYEIKHEKGIVWDKLPWKTVEIPLDKMGDFDGGIFMGLEEIDGSELARMNLNNSNLKKKAKKLRRSSDSNNDLDTAINDCQISNTNSKITKTSQIKKENKVSKISSNEIQTNELVPVPSRFDKWGDDINLHIFLIEALNNLGFESPTPIQQKAIPMTLKSDSNICGIAETGSGKTLAFILPILNTIISNWNDHYNNKICQTPLALIVAPTRELVLQITSVTTEILNYITSQHEILRQMQAVPIVGGLSEHKQKRLLMNFAKRPVQIIIATPGRLNELIEDDDILIFKDMSRLRYLVVDEVDRIMEDGHFPELNKIFNRIREHEKLTSQGLCPIEQLRLKRLGTEEVEENDDENYDNLKDTNDDIDFDKIQKQLHDELDEEIHDDLEIENNETDRSSNINENESVDETQNDNKVVQLIRPTYIPKQRQTLLFSATAGQKQQNDSNKKEKRVRGIGGGLVRSLPIHIQQLLSLVSVCTSTEVIDVSTESNNKSSDMKVSEIDAIIKLPSTLTQLEYRVTADDKDLYIYQCLLQIQGRVLVFVNSIKSARRLDGLLRALEINSRTIHAQLQQKQRMKAIESFRAAPIGVLVATDVAARGLDIPLIDTVIHYDIARSPQLYTHRSGRTARAGAKGTTISFVNPEDLQAHLSICQAFKVKSFPIWKCNPEISNILVDRIKLAKKIFTQSFVYNQEQKVTQWIKQSSQETGIEIDDDLMKELSDHKTNKKSEYSKALSKKELSILRKQLKDLLNTPLESYKQNNFKRKNSFVVFAK